MICPKCNSNIADGAAVCPVCSFTFSSDAGDGQTPVNNKKEEKVYYGYGKEYAKTKYNKKKRRRRVWSVIIPLTVMIAVVAAVILSFDFLVGFYKKTFCSPDEYFEYVMDRDMGDDHSGSIRGQLESFSKNVNGGVEVRFDDRSYLAYREDTERENRTSPSYGVSGLDGLRLTGVAKEAGTALGLYAGNDALAVFDLVGDYSKTSETVPVKIEGGYYVFYGVRVSADELLASLPSDKELDKFSQKYIDIIFEHCTGVRKATEEFGIGGVDQKLVMLEVNFGRSDMLDLKKEMMTELARDKTFRGILKNIEKKAKKSGAADGDFDILSKFDAQMKSVLDKIGEARTNVGIIVNTVRYRVFVDDAHTIVGRELTVSDKRQLYYLITREDEEFGIEFKIDSMDGTGYGTVEDGVYNGTLSAIDGGVDMLEMDIKGIKMTESGITDGKVVLKPKKRLIQDIGLPADFSRLGVVCEASFGEEKMLINVKATAEDENE